MVTKRITRRAAFGSASWNLTGEAAAPNQVDGGEVCRIRTLLCCAMPRPCLKTRDGNLPKGANISMSAVESVVEELIPSGFGHITEVQVVTMTRAAMNYLRKRDQRWLLELRQKQ